VEDWHKYIFTNKCFIEWGKGKEIKWVFSLPADKWKPKIVTTYKVGKQMRVMVWVAFWGREERSKLFVLERDFELKKHRYSTNFYIKVLEN
jgi:hypothetical protein